MKEKTGGYPRVSKNKENIIKTRSKNRPPNREDQRPAVGGWSGGTGNRERLLIVAEMPGDGLEKWFGSTFNQKKTRLFWE